MKDEYVKKVRDRHRIMYKVLTHSNPQNVEIVYYFDEKEAREVFHSPTIDQNLKVRKLLIVDTHTLDYEILSTPGRCYDVPYRDVCDLMSQD